MLTLIPLSAMTHTCETTVGISQAQKLSGFTPTPTHTLTEREGVGGGERAKLRFTATVLLKVILSSCESAMCGRVEGLDYEVLGVVFRFS